jgi:spore germination cell wall hydrolase CwlJ-like protein
MFRSFRAAGFAVAMAAFVAGVAVADPTMATEVSVPAVTTSYTDHAAATMDVTALPAEAEAAEPALAIEQIAAPEHGAATMSQAPAADIDHQAPLATLVEAYGSAEALDPEHRCLAQAVYFESKGEPLEGQLAVAEVVLNRSTSGRFPTTICGVVRQKSQFSFVRGGRIPEAPQASPAWRKAVAIAQIAMQDLAESRGAEAMFFHARYVSPGWRNLRRVGAIGNHIFYR